MGHEDLIRLLAEREAVVNQAKKIRASQNMRKALVRYGMTGAIHTVLAVGVFTAVYEYVFRQQFDSLPETVAANRSSPPAACPAPPPSPLSQTSDAPSSSYQDDSPSPPLTVDYSFSHKEQP